MDDKKIPDGLGSRPDQFGCSTVQRRSLTASVRETVDNDLQAVSFQGRYGLHFSLFYSLYCSLLTRVLGSFMKRLVLNRPGAAGYQFAAVVNLGPNPLSV